MARHARAGGRKRHQISRCRIGVAGRTRQPERQVSLMAVGNRLIGRRVFRWIIGNFLFHFCRCSWLLGSDIQRRAEECREYGSVQRHKRHSTDPSQKLASPVAWRVQHTIGVRAALCYDFLVSFLATTSSRLVPRSLSMTMAALRPGWPVTEPPGAVVPPV